MHVGEAADGDTEAEAGSVRCPKAPQPASQASSWQEATGLAPVHALAPTPLATAAIRGARSSYGTAGRLTTTGGRAHHRQQLLAAELKPQACTRYALLHRVIVLAWKIEDTS